MKQIALIVLLSSVGFAAALIGFIANRLSAEEVAVLAGVVCGVGVAVPVGVMVGAALAKRQRRDRSTATLPALYVTQLPQPTVMGSQPDGASRPQFQSTLPAARTLNIIGQNAFDVDK